MTKEARMLRVLELLASSDLALTPAVIHINLERDRMIISRKTVRRYLSELDDKDLVEEIDDRGYYAITASGRDAVQASEISDSSAN